MSSLLLFIRGFPGAGKSYLASQISKNVGANILDPDLIDISSTKFTQFSNKYKNIKWLKKVKYRFNLYETISSLGTNRVTIWSQPWRNKKGFCVTVNNIKTLFKGKINIILLQLNTPVDLSYSRRREKYSSKDAFVNKFVRKNQDIDNVVGVRVIELNNYRNYYEELKTINIGV